MIPAELRRSVSKSPFFWLFMGRNGIRGHPSIQGVPKSRWYHGAPKWLAPKPLRTISSSNSSALVPSLGGMRMGVSRTRRVREFAAGDLRIVRARVRLADWARSSGGRWR